MCEREREKERQKEQEKKRKNQLLHVIEKIKKDYEHFREWSLFFREASVDITLSLWLLKIKAEPVKLGSTSQCNLSGAILFLSSEPFSLPNLTLKQHPW